MCTGPHLYTGLSSRFESRFSFSRPPPLGVFVCLSPSLWVVLLFTIFDRLSLVLGVDPIFALAPFSGLDHLKMNIFWLLPSPFSLTRAQKQDRRISSVVVHNARLFSVCSVCVTLSPPFSFILSSNCVLSDFWDVILHVFHGLVIRTLHCVFEYFA